MIPTGALVTCAGKEAQSIGEWRPVLKFWRGVVGWRGSDGPCFTRMFHVKHQKGVEFPESAGRQDSECFT